MADTNPAAASAAKAAFNPTGKTFLERVQAFTDDVQATYSLTIHKDSGRTAEWQQKHHVAHMFAYNAYASVTPANTETGGRTIAWDHMVDTKVVWDSVLFSDILRTKENAIPKRDGAGWAKAQEPDKDASLKQAKALLIAAGIGNSGQAMVSAGLKPCGEPCKCTAGVPNTWKTRPRTSTARISRP